MLDADEQHGNCPLAPALEDEKLNAKLVEYEDIEKGGELTYLCVPSRPRRGQRRHVSPEEHIAGDSPC